MQSRQLSFSKGELTPSLHARVDTVAYATGLKTCRNFLVKKQGGLDNRPGTQFVNEIRNSAAQVRLIEFVFNDEQTYVLEFGNLYIRFYRNGAPVTVTPSDVTAWSSGTTYAIGDLVSFGGIVYRCRQAHTNVSPPDGNYWQLLSGTSTPSTQYLEVPTPYLTADLDEINFAQSADVMTFVHPDYAPRDLVRRGALQWTFEETSFGSRLSRPTGVSVARGSSLANGPGGGFYYVTAVKDGEETIASDSGILLNADNGTPQNPHVISWTAVTGADEYRIYKNSVRGGFGHLGTSDTASFSDTGQEIDYETLPPENPNPFAAHPFFVEGAIGAFTLQYPSVVGFAQQRRFFARGERICASKIGFISNFLLKLPIADDGAFIFNLRGKQVNDVRHILELNRLVALTTGGPSAINGGDSGTVTPTEINARKQNGRGASTIRPILADLLLFVSKNNRTVRGLDFSFETDRYDGPDLTTFSSHLFKRRTIVDWAYQEAPDSIVWVVLDDGALLGFTFEKAQEMAAWHRHDTDGTFERVCVVPEGTEDAVYVVVKRTINGATKRYIERLNTRAFEDIEDAVFMDSALTYDGRHTGSTTMSLSGGSTWAHTETLTLTASAATFELADIGKEFHLTGSNGTKVKFRVVGFTSSLIVTGRANKQVPAGMRSTAISTWARAVSSVSGLSHLEGKSVSIIGDGHVIASPNNPSYTAKTVSSGAVALGRHYATIHVGLPITADVETLNIDSNSRGGLVGKKKLVTKVILQVEETRGLFAGKEEPDDDSAEDLDEVIRRQASTNPDEPPELTTDEVEVIIKGEWNSNGRVFIRQTEPLPATILSITPVGEIGE